LEVEAAFKIGQFVADGASSKDEMTAALGSAAVASGLASRIGPDAISKIINQFLQAGMQETGWLHYRVERKDFART
jgi:hypothetical protein